MRRPQFRDRTQTLDEEISGNRDFGHLKRNIPAVAHDLSADLDRLFLQACQRPAFDRFRRRQRAQEIPEIVSQRMKLDTSINGLSPLLPACLRLISTFAPPSRGFQVV
jgi:hypothetical protein